MTFTSKTFDDAKAEGYLDCFLNVFYLTEKGILTAHSCRPMFEFLIDDHFKGRGVDWRDLGKTTGAQT